MQEKTQQTESVENMEHIQDNDTPLDDDMIAKGVSALIISELTPYIDETEIPILGEFCAAKKYVEDLVIVLGAKDRHLGLILRILESKKRSSLERRIYEGELNATIGAHLLKTWREEEKK